MLISPAGLQVRPSLGAQALPNWLETRKKASLILKDGTEFQGSQHSIVHRGPNYTFI